MPAVAQSPFPVKVAVVGFSGELPPPALSELAVSVRGSLLRQANPKVLAVVSREEMAAVYNARGGACPPADQDCIVAASELWAGRLFIRGVVRSVPDGIVVSARLESVRGFVVASAETPPVKGIDVAVAVPVLVRELLDGERKYREGAVARVKHPAGAVDAADAADEAPWSAPPAEVSCKSLAIQSTYVPGALVVADDGVRFDSAASSAVKLKWQYGWDKVGEIKASAHGANPALTLKPKNGDELVVYFNLGSERDICLGHIERRRGHR